MTSTAPPNPQQHSQTATPPENCIAIAWCLAWGTQTAPAISPDDLHQLRNALRNGTTADLPAPLKAIATQAQNLQDLAWPQNLATLQQTHPDLWNQPANIGLVYGGATKIKGYVFESSKLSDIRGASAILDQINLIDLPAFFEQHGKANPGSENAIAQPIDEPEAKQAEKALAWLNQDHNFPDLANALIPELIVYSTGGNILAFCPAAYVDDLANAIEKRYSEETLTANSCAVGRVYRPLEIQLGVLQPDIAKTPWLQWYQQQANQPIVEAYYGPAKNKSGQAKSPQELESQFRQRKNFSEAVGYLTADFQKRRSGNNVPGSKVPGSIRPSRRYPPRFETHPYLRRDGSEHRSVIAQADRFPPKPHFSEAQARKIHIGREAKRDKLNPAWFNEAFSYSLADSNLNSWATAKDGAIRSWVFKFEQFLKKLTPEDRDRYYYNPSDKTLHDPRTVKEARYLSEIGAASSPGKDYVAYLYADGNNMGGYIQTHINSPEAYRQFSQDVFVATEHSVYLALTKHLHPVMAPGDPDDPEHRQNDEPVHPFEIITIGGDDVLLIVPASAALQIAQTLGEQFEKILLGKADGLPSAIQQRVKGNYQETELAAAALPAIHRYRPEDAPRDRCILSTSSGVLITHIKTPIYYAEDLTSQLLKTAKERAKALKPSGYLGGTVDFQVLKNVTMISSSIKAFRREGLTITPPSSKLRKKTETPQTLKLYAAPYSLHELDGFLKTLAALKGSGYARSQLYQVRSLLAQGKRTAMLNYHYFRARLSKKQQRLLIEQFEQAWCKAKSDGNSGTLSPWMFLKEKTYETIWRELVDLYPFIAKAKQKDSNKDQPPQPPGAIAAHSAPDSEVQS